MLSIFKKNKEQPKNLYKISGMDCASCAMIIESELEDAGIKAKCSYAKQTLEVEQKDVDLELIKTLVKKSGYEIVGS